jgi:hypothetical protein
MTFLGGTLHWPRLEAEPFWDVWRQPKAWSFGRESRAIIAQIDRIPEDQITTIFDCLGLTTVSPGASLRRFRGSDAKPAGGLLRPGSSLLALA